MKKTILLIMIFLCGISAFAEEEYEYPTYGYIIAPRVNFRTGPSTSSPVARVSSMGEYHQITDTQGDWYEIDYDTGPESTILYVNKNYVAPVTGSAEIENIDGKSFSFDDGDFFGTLSFRNPDHMSVEYEIMVKSRGFQESGGNGVVLMEQSKVPYMMGSLGQPDEFWEYGVIYDKKAGKLIYAGHLWDEER